MSTSFSGGSGRGLRLVTKHEPVVFLQTSPSQILKAGNFDAYTHVKIPLTNSQNRRYLLRAKRNAKILEEIGRNKADPKPGRPDPEHGREMSDISREELDAKLAAVEARMDTRLEKFERAVEGAIASFRTDLAPLKGLKANIWSAVAVIIATFIATFAITFAAFDTGRETATLVSEAKLQQAQNKASFDSKLGEFQRQTDATKASIDAQLLQVSKQNEEALKLLLQIQQQQEAAQKETSTK